MPAMRTLKKYPDRRLYDTVEKRYVTLANVRQLVFDRIDFVVVDCRTDEDVTQPALLQVIAEEERHATPLLSRGLLLKLIRAYGSPMQNSIAVYLEESLSLLLDAEESNRLGPDEKRDRYEVSVHCVGERNF